jgi:hypothetical protein
VIVPLKKLAPDNLGRIWLPENAFVDAFAQHAGDEDRAVLSALQHPISPACITVPVSGRSEDVRPGSWLQRRTE